MLYAKSKNLNLSNVTLIFNYVVLLIRAVPTVVSDRAPDIEKRRNLCPLSGTGAVAGWAEASERFSSSSRPAAHQNMSVDRYLCCRCRARSVRGVRTARGRCGACTRSARASCCAPSHTISYCTELGSGGGGWPSQMAWRKRFLGRSDLNQKTDLMAPSARTRRVALSRPISTMLN